MTKRPFILGLTGSIGTGKSTTADMFRAQGIPVWDADATVHYLYDEDKTVAQKLARLIPGAVIDGKVNRDALRMAVRQDGSLLKKIEFLIHPLVAENRNTFLEHWSAKDETMVLCDIPLLFETKADKWCDAVLVVSIDADEQQQRVLSRPGMTEEMFDMILGMQLPDREKRDRADYVIETTSIEFVERAVKKLIGKIQESQDA